jgi:hypothetical protein
MHEDIIFSFKTFHLESLYRLKHGQRHSLPSVRNEGRKLFTILHKTKGIYTLLNTIIKKLTKYSDKIFCLFMECLPALNILKTEDMILHMKVRNICWMSVFSPNKFSMYDAMEYYIILLFYGTLYKLISGRLITWQAVCTLCYWELVGLSNHVQ